MNLILLVFWERGSPDLPVCGLRRGSRGGPVRPSSSAQDTRPSRGTKPHGADNIGLPKERPRQAGSRGGGEMKARGTSRGAHDASHDDRDQEGTSQRSFLVSCLVQRGKAQARSTDASGKGFHISATRPRLAGRQDGGHRGAYNSVTDKSPTYL